MLLFNSGELRLVLQARSKAMRAAVEAEPEESLRRADAAEWAAALAHHFGVACPELRGDDVWREPVEDVKVDVSWDRRRYFSDSDSELARSFPGYRLVVHVPFEGDRQVFDLTPSSRTLNPPRGQVKDSELVLTIDYPRDTQPDVDGEVRAFIDSVAQWLVFARRDIEEFNSTLQEQAGQAIETRRQQIEQRDAHLAQSSIPEKRPGSRDKKYIPDVLIRRPAPSLPEARADQKPPTLEPVLDERIFEHILDVIRMQSRQMEQSPGTYEQMGEEDRRQTIVATLNTHYAGHAHAEAFNVTGKTDILIRHDGRNLFICECKFWGGAESFTQTIDQLFRYAGWRDTKLAIIMFVREKALTEILQKAKTTLEKHPQFVRWKEPDNETELRAAMCWPGDQARLADLNIFFVHTPRRAQGNACGG